MKKSIRLFTTVMVCMAMALCVSCKKDNAEPSGGGNGGGGTQTVATVTTDEVTDITCATAVCGGEVKSENGWAVTERGVCWGVEPNPTPSDNHTVDGEGVGKFISEITGLEPDTKYYVRAYAKNAAGTGFGEQKSFTTQSGGGGGQTQTFTVNGVSFEMVRVDGGTFTMGATQEQGGDAYDDEFPTHSVTLSDYYIGKFEVTQELWLAVMGSWPGTAPSGSYGVGDDYPAYYISWDDCQDFITELNRLTGANFRLPTEAEWEYAARGGSESGGYKYSGSNSINDVAWYYDNSDCKTHSVGTKSPNELGIYDMSGNVYEWCQDWYGSYSSGLQTNPQGPSSGSDRVLRGGCWNNYARYCRVSYRYYNYPFYRFNFYGLRLALVP
ncbi:MAG: SUMF1/EgtB/PvdO family nonheme iron enzyme [Bacteroidales bacterium]|nr:SUMF1/EgtB/PvdO family nonheme iron enzyme [Bacteroidales bacterium]